MQFYFPEDKQGYKYVFVVHPGADMSQIKMRYPDNEKTILTNDGNIIVQSSFGEFTDHTPVADQSGRIIKCSFIKNNGTIQFIAGEYNEDQELTLDPWTTTPSFSGTN